MLTQILRLKIFKTKKEKKNEKELKAKSIFVNMTEKTESSIN